MHKLIELLGALRENDIELGNVLLTKITDQLADAILSVDQTRLRVQGLALTVAIRSLQQRTKDNDPDAAYTVGLGTALAALIGQVLERLEAIAPHGGYLA